MSERRDVLQEPRRRRAAGAGRRPDPWMERYSRQLVLPEWSEAAQRALGEASVLVVGAGALGSPVATYLAGAGVGRLGIVDDGDVELSNLHRQHLHFTPDVGVPKAHSAAAKLGFLNPEIVIEPYQAAFNAGDGRGPGPRRRLHRLVRGPLRDQRRLLRRRRAARGGRRGRHERARDGDPAGGDGLLPLRVPAGPAAGRRADAAPRRACSARRRA